MAWDGEAANARPGKNGFGDDGAGEESAELKTKDDDDWNEGVAQSVTKENGSGGQTLRAGGADIIARKLFEHRTTNHASKNGCEGGTQSGGGKNVIQRPTASGNGEPTELDGK